MSHFEVRKLSKAVNAEARRHGLIGAKERVTEHVLRRLVLRNNTPYPYSFTEDDTLFPQNPESFGRVIRRNREEGLREIHASIGRQRKEHAWIFVPALPAWIDMTFSAGEADVNTDRDGQLYLAHIFPEIEAVHTHPDSIVRDLAVTQPRNYSTNYLLEAALPSVPDLLGHTQMASLSVGTVKLADSVVSHYGVTTFAVNEIGFGEGYDVSPEPYERRIQGTVVDPVAAIRTALSALQSHFVRFDTDTPAFLHTFKPFV